MNVFKLVFILPKLISKEILHNDIRVAVSVGFLHLNKHFGDTPVNDPVQLFVRSMRKV